MEFPALCREELAAELMKIKDPLIVMHVRPDGDTVGSAAALCHIYAQFGVRADLICADPIPSRLLFLTENCGAGKYSESKQYTPIAVDVASPSQLGCVATLISPKIMIDHHGVGQAFAPHYIKTVSATGEIIADLAFFMLENKYIREITPELAEALYAAISSDTGCFKYSNASPETYRTAARLLEFGADAAKINHLLFESKRIEQLRAEALAVENMKLGANGKISYTTVTFAEMQEKGIEPEDTDTMIEAARCMEGTDIAFLVRQSGDREYKISLRSSGPDVASVAKIHGGGGHVRAAGCTLTADSTQDAVEILLPELEKLLL